MPGGLKEAYAAAEGVAVIEMNQHPYFLGHDVVARYFHNHHSGPDPISLAVAGAPMVNLAAIPGQTLPAGSATDEQLASAEPRTSFLPDDKAATIGVADAAVSFPIHLVSNLDASRDIASQAAVESSSGDPDPAIDGIADGFPHDQKKEWVTNGQTNGAWIKLTWPQSVEVSSVALYDRPNPVDHILAGTLEFSDGSKEDVGVLPNDGLSPRIISFPKKSVQWLKFTVTETDPCHQERRPGGNCSLSKLTLAARSSDGEMHGLQCQITLYRLSMRTEHLKFDVHDSLMHSKRRSVRWCFKIRARLNNMTAFILVMGVLMVGARAEINGDPGPTPPQLTFPDPALQTTVGSAYQLALKNLLLLNTVVDPKANQPDAAGIFRYPPGAIIRAGGDYPSSWTPRRLDQLLERRFPALPPGRLEHALVGGGAA